MEERHSYEFYRDRELRNLIDQIPLPEDSCSDFSSASIQSPFELENQSFSQPDLSPTHHDEMYFDNSINFTIVHSSPISQSKQFSFEDESEHLSQISQSSQGPFNLHQVSKMMDWSKTYITPTEGLFPQVSAPSMSLDPEDYQHSIYETPSREIIPVFQRDTGLKRAHISFENLEIAKVNSLTKRTVSSNGAPGRTSREGTFSPKNTNEGANWFFAPASTSKRLSINQSLKSSTQKSNQSVELGNQVNLQYENSIPENTEFHKILNELSLVKIELKKEQEVSERLRKELNDAKERKYSLEGENNDLIDQVDDLKEHLKFLKTQYKDSSTLESLRGKTLEYAKLEIKQLKTYLSDREKQIIYLKQVYKNELANKDTELKDKAIEELTLEITKFKILDSANKKKIQELLEKLDSIQRDRKKFQQDKHYKKDEYETHIQSLEKQISTYEQTLNFKSTVNQFPRAIKESEGSFCTMTGQKSKVEELKLAKMTIESLKQEIEDLKAGRVQNVEYEINLQKMRSSFEKSLEKSKEDARTYKHKHDKLQEKILVLEEQVKQYQIKLSNSETRCMNSSICIKDSVDEREVDKEAIEIMREEIQNMVEIIAELRFKNNEWKNVEMHLKQQISELHKEKEELTSDFEEERIELSQKIKDLENQNYSRIKNIKSMENSLQQARENIMYLENEVEKTKTARQEAEKLMDIYKKQADEFKSLESKSHNDIGVVTSIEDLHEIKKKLENETEQYEAKIKEFTVERDNAYRKLKNEREEFDLQMMEKSQNIDALKEELKNSKTNRLRLEREIKRNYEDKIKALEGELEESKLSALTNNSRVQNLNDKIETLQEEKKRLEIEFKSYKDKLMNQSRELQDKLNMYHDLETQIYTYKQNLIDKSNEIESLKNTLLDTERSMTSLSSSRDIDFKYQQMLDELNSLKEQLKNTQKETSNESKLIAQNQYLTQQMTSVEQINQEYMQRIHYLEDQLRLDEDSKSYENKESSRITYKDESFDKDSLETLKEENDNLITIISEYKTKSEEWKNIEIHLQTKIHKLKQDKQEYETQLQDLQHQFKELESQNNHKISIIDIHIKEQDQFEKKILDQAREFKNEKEELGQRLEELEAAGKQRNREKKELVGKIKELNTQNDELKQKMIDLSSLAKSLEEEKTAFHKKNADLMRETAQKEVRLAEYDHRIQELENQNKLQSKAIKRLESSVKQSKDNTIYLEKEMESLEVARVESEQLADRYKRQLEENKQIKLIPKLEIEDIHKSTKNFEIEQNNLIEKYEERLRKLNKETEQLQRKLDKQAEDYEFEMSDKDEYINSLKEDLKNFRTNKLKNEREIRDSYESKIISLEQELDRSKRTTRSGPKLTDSSSITTQTNFRAAQPPEQLKSIDRLTKQKNSLENSTISTQTTLDISQMRSQLKAKFKSEYDSELRKKLQDILNNYISYKDFDKELVKKLDQVHEEWKTKMNKADAKHNKKLKDTVRGYETKFHNIENEFSNKISDFQLESEEKIVKLKDFYETKIRNIKEEKCIISEQLESSKKFQLNNGITRDEKLIEYKELIAEYEKQLRNISEQYKNYIIKTKTCLENAVVEREEHTKTTEILINKVQSYEQRIQYYDENPLISPEMLSPEETCSLVINIFKRSNRESVMSQLLQTNSEFLSLVHEFLDIPYGHYSQTPSRNLTFIDTSQSHIDYSLDSRPKLSLPLPVNRPDAPYTENLYTGRSNLTIPRPKSVNEICNPANVPSFRSLSISATNRSMKRQPLLSRNSQISNKSSSDIVQIQDQVSYIFSTY